MKIIEAMKEIKALKRKHEDLMKKVHTHCANLDYETAVYADQQKQVSEWIQACQDVCSEIERLDERIKQTNLVTEVTIEIDGKTISKSITRWLNRKNVLISMEKSLYQGLGDKGLREGQLQTSAGQINNVKIRRYYDPEKRDKKIQSLLSEPYLIDSKLEVINAITDLVN